MLSRRRLGHGFLCSLSFGAGEVQWYCCRYLFTGRAGDNAFPALFSVKVCHSVVGSSKLEAEDWLKVFALQQDFAFEAIAEIRGVGEVGFSDNIVDARGEDETEILSISVIAFLLNWLDAYVWVAV